MNTKKKLQSVLETEEMMQAWKGFNEKERERRRKFQKKRAEHKQGQRTNERFEKE